MSSISTYSSTYGTATQRTATSTRKGLFQRAIDRMVAARMRRAEEFLRQHQHLIPRELEDQAGWKLTERSEDSLPFIR